MPRRGVSRGNFALVIYLKAKSWNSASLRHFFINNEEKQGKRSFWKKNQNNSVVAHIYVPSQKKTQTHQSQSKYLKSRKAGLKFLVPTKMLPHVEKFDGIIFDFREYQKLDSFWRD